MCTPDYTGENCHLPVQEKMILVASGAYWVIGFVLINVIGKTSSTSTLKALSLKPPLFHLLLRPFEF